MFTRIGARGPRSAVFPDDGLLVDAPDLSRAFAHLAFGGAGGLDGGKAHGKGHAAAVGHLVLPE